MICVTYHPADTATVRDDLVPRLRSRYDAATIHLRDGEPGEADLPAGVVLAVVGEGWASDPADAADRATATALACGLPVVPVLLGTASLPRPADLPADSPLRKLAYLPGVRLRPGPTFEADVQALLFHVDALLRAGFGPVNGTAEAVAEARHEAIDEAAILAGVEEIRRTGGHRFEDLIAELERVADGHE